MLYEQQIYFSWAENINGKMVHIDSVPRGINCRCFCPYCHEELIARQGYIYEHGFAHHSKKRRANLEICYKVTLYKLAEYIIQTKNEYMFHHTTISLKKTTSALLT